MKAQASVEFMSTYLWAALAIALALGVLYGFGVFDTEKYVQQGCDTGEQITCVDAVAFEDGTFVLLVRNDLGHVLKIKELTILNPEYAYSETYDIVVLQGEGAVLHPQLPVTLEKGKKISFEFIIVIETEHLGRPYTVAGISTIEVIEGPDPTQHPQCGDGLINGDEVCDGTASPTGCTSPRVCAPDCLSCRSGNIEEDYGLGEIN